MTIAQQTAENQMRRMSIPEFVCWSRMQSEAGQELTKILKRKENERQAGDGMFFWGVGNAPSTAISSLARLRCEIPVYFSIMKTKPKLADSAPSSLVIWRCYIDLCGTEKALPPFALITSRGNSENGRRKTRHFALMCQSDCKLELRYGYPFHHYTYRNAGPNGGQIGASQVTALLTRDASIETAIAQYEINLQARLTGSYWVRLTDPLPLSESQIALYNSADVINPSDWIGFVSDLREKTSTRADTERQLGLF
ncbi:hypothetical protein G9X67_03500 [Rhizobium sp. WYCCWR 11152]|uniref:hypothetical protein n=1 Tax=Rhizobium sp. WYCCWR 11152 TaxID=2692316 RepID=UPI0014920012|nr:hypothetical protein [Rhizobium sp. WYCCWR 11152]NNU64352.1 hypothetical protein [Rhizobium sp. WYCCWR 11152]